ncbi:hypothetical protein [Sporosarcina sp. FSL W7-1283]
MIENIRKNGVYIGFCRLNGYMYRVDSKVYGYNKDGVKQIV